MTARPLSLEPDPSGPGEVPLDVRVLPQPDDVACGPACPHAVYRCWGDRGPSPLVTKRNYLAEKILAISI